MEKMSRHFFGTAGGGSGAVFLSGGVNPVVPTGRIIPENAPGVLKLTRSVRRQLYTADIVFAMSMCLEGRLPKKTRDVLGRVRARVDNINRIIYGGGRFVLSSRDYKKYNRIISEIKTIIMEMSDDNHLGPDFFNAVMLMVEDVYESVQASTSKGLKHEWAMLRRSMGRFASMCSMSRRGRLVLSFRVTPKYTIIGKPIGPGMHMRPWGLPWGKGLKG